LAKIICPWIPVLLHYHGDDIRNRETPYLIKKLAKKIVVSTLDLVRDNFELYTCPISPRFRDYENRKQKTALYCLTPPVDQTEKAKAFCQEHDLELTILDRKEKYIPYSQLPEFLSSFEYVLDLKGLTSPSVISKLALEAISCGCKILVDTGEIITTFPTRTGKDYFNLYQEMLK
jgi:hypothetical protein